MKNWRPKTQSGRLTRAGRFPNYTSVRKRKFGVQEPEIADYFFGKELMIAPLKVVPIGDGQYRFKAYVAVGDGKYSIGLGQRCAKDRKGAEEGAVRNAKLNIMKLKTTWFKPVTGRYGNVTIRLFQHQQLSARPMIRRVLDICGIKGCKVETNTERDCPQLVLALFDALAQLEL